MSNEIIEDKLHTSNDVRQINVIDQVPTKFANYVRICRQFVEFQHIICDDFRSVGQLRPVVV